MTAWADSKLARRRISDWGYATPSACEHLRTPSASFAAGAWAMLVPFRSSLPESYRYWPASVADMVALRSDWSLYGMDYTYVCRTKLPSIESGQQALFDPDSSSP